MYTSSFSNRKDVRGASAGQELAEPVDYSLCHISYNVRYQSGCRSTSRNFFVPQDLYDLSDLSDGNDKFWWPSSSILFSCLVRVVIIKDGVLTDEWEVVDVGNRVKVEVTEEEVINAEHTPIFYITAPLYYEQNMRSQSLRSDTFVK